MKQITIINPEKFEELEKNKLLKELDWKAMLRFAQLTEDCLAKGHTFDLIAHVDPKNSLDKEKTQYKVYVEGDRSYYLPHYQYVQARVEIRKEFKELTGRWLSTKGDSEEIDRAMLPFYIVVLSLFWKYGQELLVWHNEKAQNDPHYYPINQETDLEPGYIIKKQWWEKKEWEGVEYLDRAHKVVRAPFKLL